MLFNQVFHPLDKFFLRAGADSIQSVDERQKFGKLLTITVVIFKPLLLIDDFPRDQGVGVVGQEVFQLFALLLHGIGLE